MSLSRVHDAPKLLGRPPLLNTAKHHQASRHSSACRSNRARLMGRIPQRIRHAGDDQQPDNNRNDQQTRLFIQSPIGTAREGAETFIKKGRGTLAQGGMECVGERSFLREEHGAQIENEPVVFDAGDHRHAAGGLAQARFELRGGVAQAGDAN